MNKIIKIPNKSYTDGWIQFGDYEVVEDEKGHEVDKIFTPSGRISFSFETYREQDKYKFDTENVKIDMKISVPYHRSLNSKHKILIKGTLYSTKYLDVDKIKNTVYLYLTELKDILDKQIDIIHIVRASRFDTPKEELLKTVFANIQKVNISIKDLAEKTKFDNQYTIIIKQNSIIEEYEKNGLLHDILIGVDNVRFTITHINIKDSENSLYELIVKEV